jgi:hypothetical protein
MALYFFKTILSPLNSFSKQTHLSLKLSLIFPTTIPNFLTSPIAFILSPDLGENFQRNYQGRANRIGSTNTQRTLKWLLYPPIQLPKTQR